MTDTPKRKPKSASKADPKPARAPFQAPVTIIPPGYRGGSLNGVLVPLGDSSYHSFPLSPDHK